MMCPNLKNPQVAQEFNELVQAVGEKAAYDIWNQNNGYGIESAPNGAPSKLFSDLLSEFDGNRELTIKAKAKVFSKEFKTWFGDWSNSLRSNEIVFGHPGIGKTFSFEQGKYKDRFIDWDVEFNEKRDKWIEEHSNTVKGTEAYKKVRNEYLIYPEKHKDYSNFITNEWNRVKEKAKLENKILFASPHTLLKMFSEDLHALLIFQPWISSNETLIVAGKK